MSDLIFIEASGEDGASTLMLAVSQKAAEGYALMGGLVPAGDLLGQWMEMRGGILAPQYKLVRARTPGVLQETVRVLVNEGWDMHEGTVFGAGKYLQWMWHPVIWRPNAENQVPVMDQAEYSIEA